MKTDELVEFAQWLRATGRLIETYHTSCSPQTLVNKFIESAWRAPSHRREGN